MGLFGSRKNSDDNRNFHIFEEAQQQAGENVQLVLRKSDLYPIHISPNFKRVLGVEPARMVDDVETLWHPCPQRRVLHAHRPAAAKAPAHHPFARDERRVPFRNHHRRYAQASDYRAA